MAGSLGRSRLLIVVDVPVIGQVPSAPALAGTVFRDGDGDGFSWDDPLNRVGGALPGPADDGVINVPGVVTSVHDTGNDTINSLTSMERLELSGGSLSIAAAPFGDVARCAVVVDPDDHGSRRGASAQKGSSVSGVSCSHCPSSNAWGLRLSTSRNHASGYPFSTASPGSSCT